MKPVNPSSRPVVLTLLLILVVLTVLAVLIVLAVLVVLVFVALGLPDGGLAKAREERAGLPRVERGPRERGGARENRVETAGEVVVRREHKLVRRDALALKPLAVRHRDVGVGDAHGEGHEGEVVERAALGGLAVEHAVHDLAGRYVHYER